MSRTRPRPSPRFFVVATTLLVLTSVAFGGGDTCVNYGDFLHLREFLAVPGQGQRVVVSGRYAYMAQRSSLQVIDIIDPEAPVITGSAWC